MMAVQIKMARAAVGWGVRELAREAGLTANTVTRIENGGDAKHSSMVAIQRALEAAGVIFLADGEDSDGGPGVRLARSIRGQVSIPGDQLNSSNDE